MSDSRMEIILEKRCLMIETSFDWTLKKLNQFKPVMSIAQLVSIPEFPLFGGRFRPIMSRPNALDFSLISRWRRYREYIRTVMTSHSLNVCPLLLTTSVSMSANLKRGRAAHLSDKFDRMFPRFPGPAKWSML